MLIPAMAIAFGVTAILVIALRPMAASIGLVDRPGGRKQHIGAVPIIGGISMFAGIVVSAVLIDTGPTVSSFMVAAGLLVLVGMLDDRYALPAGVRLGAQLLGVLIVFYGAGFRITSLGDIFAIGDVNLGFASLLFTTLIAISVINAYNLVDGADGLAGTMGVLALGPVAIIATYGSTAGSLSVVGIGAILGFLCFNFPTVYNRRVRTFMGDAGSTMIGLLVFCAIAGVTQGDAALLSPAVGLWFAAVPIFDLFTCFMRRIRRRRSPFKPGRDHFHHVLARGGFRVRKTLAILTIMQITYMSFGLLGHFASIPEPAMFALWAGVGLTQWWLVRKFAAMARKNRREPIGPDSEDQSRPRAA